MLIEKDVVLDSCVIADEMAGLTTPWYNPESKPLLSRYHKNR